MDGEPESLGKALSVASEHCFEGADKKHTYSQTVVQCVSIFMG